MPYRYQSYDYIIEFSYGFFNSTNKLASDRLMIDLCYLPINPSNILEISITSHTENPSFYL